MKNLKLILSLTILALSFMTSPYLGGAMVLGMAAVTYLPKGALGSLITPADLTFNGKEIMSLSEAIFEAVFEKPTLGLFHSITTGIKARQQIAFLGRLGLIGKQATGCDPASQTNNVPMTEKFWEPCSIFNRLEQCWDDLEGTFFVWGKKNGIDAPDLSGTDFANFIEDRLSDELYESVLRHAWFGDIDAATVSDSPAGVMTAGSDVDYWNCIDGLWKQLFAITTADAARLVDIANNDEITYALQEFDATDTTNKVVSGIFRDIIQKADHRLRSKSDKIILCTLSLADQYENELESDNVDASFEMIMDGVSVLKRKGVTIIAFEFWDRMIRTYFDNGAAYYKPHRALLTTKEQIQIGCEEEGSLSKMAPSYDTTTLKYLIDTLYKLDAKIMEDYMVQVAH